MNRSRDICPTRLPFMIVVMLALFVLPRVGRPQRLARPVELGLAANATRAHLERFKQFLLAEQWDEAVDTLASLLESPTQELILAEGQPGAFAQYLPVREYCHLQFVQLSRKAPQALETYRQRVDPLAKRWLDDGLAGLDKGALLRVVEQMYASRHADRALLALGDQAFERGRIQLAREYWQQIVPLARTPNTSTDIVGARLDHSLWHGLKDVNPSEYEKVRDWLTAQRQTSGRLAYPDSELPAADVLARLVLASVMEDASARAELELRVLRLLFPTAKGRLAGKRGPWQQLLAEFAKSSQAWPQPPSSRQWPQFAGALSRNLVAPLDPDPGLKPLWNASLEVESAPNEAFADGRQRTGERSNGLLSVHPLVLGDRVYVPQRNSILGFHLSTGAGGFASTVDPKNAPQNAIYRHPLIPQEVDSLTYYGVPRYTLSSHKQHLFARVGSPHTCWPQGRVEPLKKEQWGVIVGMDLSSQGKLLPGFPLRPDDASWAFDGVPVSDGARLYVAMRRRDPARVQLHVACFETSSGKRLWRTRLAARDPYGDGPSVEISHTLLTLDNGRLFVNSNMGAIACIQARDGAVRWVTAYPRQPPRPSDIDKSDRHFFRDLNPCVAWRGLVFAAPSDSDRVFAIDQTTGRLIWTLRPGLAGNASYVLGVAKNTLILGGDALYWINATSGQMLCRFPNASHGGDGFSLPASRGQGRGVLAGDNVYFPTAKNVLVFRQEPLNHNGGWTPQAARAPIDLVRRGHHGGNLVVAGSYLLICGHDRISAFATSAAPTGRRETAKVQ